MKALILTYKTAPISVRESVAFTDTESRSFMYKLKEVFELSEALLISTCNRTELYYESDQNINHELVGFIASEKGLSASVIRHNFKYLENDEAMNHLFRVSLGLDSQVLGDIQISNQVKRSYQISADLELAGPVLHRLLHTIFYANKRVVQETRLQDGNASTASVSADIIKSFNLKFHSSKIAIIGIGEIGQNLLDNLSDLKDTEITLVNRTRSKADEIAAEKGCLVEDFQNLDEVLEKNDVVVSAVSAKFPIINTGSFIRQVHHKLLIDLSVPRSIDTEVGQIPGISLYNVDQLVEKTKKARKIREKSIPDAEQIIEESLIGFNQWKDEMEVSPTIQKLKNALEDIRKKELAKHMSKASEADMELLEVVTKNMVQKLIKLPVIQLKAACKRGEADSLVEVLNDLFDLEKEHSYNK